MTTDQTMRPIVHEQLVEGPAAQAFTAFITHLGDWWDPRLTADPDTFRGAEVEPEVGGEVRFVHHGSLRYPIGRLTDWQPGRRLAMDYVLALDPAHPTNLTVTFGAREHGTLVVLTHGGWTSENVAERTKFTEWPSLLARFATYVAGRPLS